MKESIAILCLANSVKNQEHCVAGVRLDTGGWIRPVSDEYGSALLTNQCTTESGHVPEPLDTVKLELRRQYAKYNQPENWVISGKDWQLLDTELNVRQLLALNIAIQREGAVISDARKSIPKHELKESPLLNSLTVLRPQNPRFYIKTTGGNRRPYADFTFDGNEYSLPITDPDWREKVESEEVEALPSVDAVDDAKEVLFTISLGEEYEGRCYKMIAAIFCVESDKLVGV